MNLRNQHSIPFILKHFLLGIFLLGTVSCYNHTIEPGPASTGGSASAESKPPVENGLPGGITNLGCTCYMNATLQILSAYYEPCISKLNHTDPLAAALNQVFHAMKVEKRTVTSAEARAVFEALGQFGWTTNERKQCDASDLLHLIWEWMHGPLFQTENICNQHGPEGNQIQVSSKVKVEDACMHYVALPNDGETCSMQPLFDQSLLPEQIRGQYKKEDGTHIANVYKHKQLKLNGEILPLQLNRFYTKGGRIEQEDHSFKEEPFEKVKLQNKVINSMGLKISQNQTTNNQDKYYTLVGFIWHSGSIDGGHYKAFVRQKKGTWLCYNDSSVTEINDVAAKEEAQNAYVYFYQPNSQPTEGS